jgi:alkylresorcinol/alkylpyrone synthase
MPYISSIATSTPKHVLKQSAVVEMARKLFGATPEFDSMLSVFENARVNSRSLCVDAEWLMKPHPFTESNDIYIETALSLSETVALEAAERAGCKTQDFDAIFFVSTTGLATPSVDARLFNRIPLNQHIKRIPIWGLGCAAGAGGLARVFDYLKAYPRHRALLISVELCSLSFHMNDASKTNLISAAIFGDGAAACVVCGDEVPDTSSGSVKTHIKGSLSTIFADTLDMMAWRATTDGFYVTLSKDIPSFVMAHMKENVGALLKNAELKSSDVSHFVMHPGGARVLKSYAESLALSDDHFADSYRVLADYGNMSSATVFFILKNLLDRGAPKQGDLGVLGALGPGFSSELVLLEWS